MLSLNNCWWAVSKLLSRICVQLLQNSTGGMNCWLVVKPCAVMSLALRSTANSSDSTGPEQSRVHSQVYPSQSNPKCSFGRTSQTTGFFLFLREKVAPLSSWGSQQRNDSLSVLRRRKVCFCLAFSVRTYGTERQPVLDSELLEEWGSVKWHQHHQGRALHCSRWDCQSSHSIWP